MARVLVVDDDCELLGALTLALSDAFEVVAAEDGHAAWAVLNDGPVDAVITDLRMPGMSGGTLCEKIRDRAGIASLPVILVSGEYSPPAFVRYDCYLRKPLDMQQLVETTKRLLLADPFRAIGNPVGRPHERLPD
ncbi:response regulator receiver domain-containing protein [Paraburkholderia eburnea]|uniref:Response regulator receiver domain-containing protein n=1 Tax=Paraburkholderia eburnea TaxID=1189126 RepID=A0A2S4M277_9BURK|nr:response regulator [Paraburkholderia eburnea]POR48811.1 response regulator receiver domain-containing protein [Paraburkholderia eburnea]PRZ20926.1 response regulator receiver domain-containing protein [Paraburkholderia eburnea]